MSDETLYSASEAAEYLGIHKQTLEKLQRSGRLKRDFITSGGHRVYKQKTLEEYRTRWQSNRLSFDEIASIFGITKDAVHYHFRRKRSISPAGFRRGAMVFRPSTVLMVAKNEKWIDQVTEANGRKESVGVGYLPKTGEWIVYQYDKLRFRILGKSDDSDAVMALYGIELDRLE